MGPETAGPHRLSETGFSVKNKPPWSKNMLASVYAKEGTVRPARWARPTCPQGSTGPGKS